MKPLQPLAPVRPEFVGLLQSLAEGIGHAEIVADWLLEQCVDPADVCLIYARDRQACEGLEEMACPCGWKPTRDVNRRKGDPSACPKCAYADRRGGVRWCNLWPLLPCDFPQTLLGEWAERVYGRSRKIAIWHVQRPRYEDMPAGMMLRDQRADSIWANRELKRRTLRLLPEVGRNVFVAHDGIGVMSRWGEAGDYFVHGIPGIDPCKPAHHVDGPVRGYEQTLRAEDFVPAEPGPVWSNYRVQEFIAGEPLTVGDYVRIDDQGRVVRHDGVMPVVGAAMYSVPRGRTVQVLT